MDKQPGPPSSKRVSFTEIVQSFHQDHSSSECFYSMEDLRDHLENELRALSLVSSVSLEDSNKFTWRGLEEFRAGKKDAGQRKTKRAAHANNVLKEWKRQQTKGDSEEELLRIVSKESSKQDRNRALLKGSSDAKEQGHKTASKGIRKTLSRSFSSIKVSLRRSSSTASTTFSSGKIKHVNTHATSA